MLYSAIQRDTLNKQKKGFAAVVLILIVACAYGLPLLGGFTWSPSIYSPQGSKTYSGRPLATLTAFNSGSDANFVEPRNYLLSVYLKSGTLPLWNPYETTGLPFAADFESKALFPINMLQALFPHRTWDFFYLLRIWLAGFFTFLLLQEYLVSVPVSLFGAILYMLSGPVAYFVSMEEAINGTLLLPWLIYGAHKLAGEYSFKHVFGLAMPIALMIHAGQPKLGILGITVTLAYLYTASIHTGQLSLSLVSLPKTGSTLLKLILPLFIGLVLAAPQVLLSCEYLGRSFSVPTDFAFSAEDKSGSGILGHILEMLFKFKIGTFTWEAPQGLLLTALPNTLDIHWGGHPVHIGITAFFFVFFAIVSYRLFEGYQRFLVLFWTVAGFILVSANYGFPLTTWIVTLPPLNCIAGYKGYVRYYAPIFVLSSVIVASLGVELFGRLQIHTRKKYSMIAMAVLISFLVFAYFLPGLLESRLIDGIVGSQSISFNKSKSLTILLLVVSCIMFLGTKCLSPSISWCVALLVFCELASYVPYGFDKQWELYRLIPFVTGIVGIFALIYSMTRAWIFSLIAYIVVMFALITLSPCGLPEWHNPFREPPYVSFLKNDQEEFRTYGIESEFLADYTSVFQIKDIRVMAPFVPLNFVKYIGYSLCPSQYPPEFQGTAGGNWPYLLTGLNELYHFRGVYNFLGIKYLITNKKNRLDVEPLPYLGDTYSRGYAELRLKRGDVLSIRFPNAPSKICGVAILATSGGEVLYRLIGEDGAMLGEGTVPISSKVPSMSFFPTLDGVRECSLELRVSDECNIYYFTHVPGNAMQVSRNNETVKGAVGAFILQPREDIKLVYDADERIYENKNVFPRAYMVYDVRPFTCNREGFKMLSDIDLRTTAFVDCIEGKVVEHYTPGSNDVKIIQYAPHSVTVDVSTERPGLLVLTDTFYPGWRAYVDGKRQEICRVNGLVRGVTISTAGRHQVKFVYRPVGFYLGAIMSICTLAAALIMLKRGT